MEENLRKRAQSLIRLESECVDCDLPCLGSACQYMNVARRYCDICGEIADYVVDGQDLCEECAHKLADDEFKRLEFFQKCELLEIDYVEI